MTEVVSPCIQVCRLNESGACMGCGRTRAEIGSWLRASNTERADIVIAAAARLAAMAETQ